MSRKVNVRPQRLRGIRLPYNAGALGMKGLYDCVDAVRGHMRGVVRICL